MWGNAMNDQPRPASGRRGMKLSRTGRKLTRTEAYKHYATVQARTDRELPVLRLSPTGSTPAPLATTTTLTARSSPPPQEHHPLNQTRQAPSLHYHSPPRHPSLPP